VLGLILFLAPSWSAPRFAWKVSNFVTMTIGAWCLGAAWAAVTAARTWRWAEARVVFLYLWGFSILEALVLVWFRHKVVFDVLTWPYFIALGSGVVAAASGLADVARTRPTSEDTEGMPMTRWLRGLVVAFVVFVGALAAVALIHPSTGANLRVFPEKLSPFTVRGFGAFYLALVIGSLPLLTAGTIGSMLAYLRGLFVLLVLTTAAAFVYLRVFDMSAHPLQSLYLVAYLGTLVLTVFILGWARTRSRAIDRGPAVPAG